VTIASHLRNMVYDVWRDNLGSGGYREPRILRRLSRRAGNRLGMLQQGSSLIRMSSGAVVLWDLHQRWYKE
jgi:hypothetical protein